MNLVFQIRVIIHYNVQVHIGHPYNIYPYNKGYCELEAETSRDAIDFASIQRTSIKSLCTYLFAFSNEGY